MNENSLLTTLQQQQGKMEDTLNQVDRGIIDPVNTTGMWEPAVDVGVDGDHLVILMDLPGVSQEQIGIRLNDDCLIVEGQRQPASEHLRLQRQECPNGRFSRSLYLPPGVRSEHLSARCEQGVLRIEIRGLTAEDQVRVDDEQRVTTGAW